MLGQLINKLSGSNKNQEREKEILEYRITLPFLNGMNEIFGEFIKYLNEAQHTVKIVCGGSNLYFYGSHEYLAATEHFLKTGRDDFSLVFNAGTDNLNEAINKLKKDNRTFLNMVKKLDPSEQEKVKFYWCDRRPNLQYMLVDDRHRLIEKEHQTGKERAIEVIKYKPNSETMKEWYESFQKMTGYCIPLKLKQLS